MSSLTWGELCSEGPSLTFFRVGQETESLSFQGITVLDYPKTGHILFIKEKKYLTSFFQKTEEKAEIYHNHFVILEEKLAEKLSSEELEKVSLNCSSLLLSQDVGLSMSFISQLFHQKLVEKRNPFLDGRQAGTTDIHPTSMIAQGVFLGEGVKIGAFVKIHSGVVIQDNVEIDEKTEIFPQVHLYPDCKIGKNCRIHSQTVIGSDGFGYEYRQGTHHKVWHLGTVEIADNVEIGASCCVDRGTFSPTLIGEGSKIDNHVHIGHNCRLGKGVIICGQTALAGSVTLDDYCVLGGKVAVGPGFRLGQGCQVGGGGLVSCDWPAGSTITGYPARSVKEWLKGLAYVRKHALNK